MALTRSRLHNNSHPIHETSNLNNPDEVSQDNILGYDDQPIKPKNKKITFDEDGDDLNEEVEQDSNEEDSKLGDVEESEVDLDSDSDEAPEEESTSTAKNQLQAQQNELKQQEIAKQRQIKEQRKLQNERNIQQKKAKRELEAKELEKSKNILQKPEKLPEFLPDNISISLPSTTTTTTPKHLKEDDFSIIENEKLRKAQIELRLKKLKQSNKQSIKKGPVYVKTQTFNTKNIVVPKSENKILKNKSKWLNRKSINRK
ncbi:hypothetical protein KGF54_002587 [Candida jiufengensis]|uniref:uncharacterized protein n=1 Tax=Candida jiufengensis TaxID=497108 RepID=UPI0022243903|nr:uncharacterized protein KGF54_002587 [Candida jiufengensis]KAI5953216.1 hypothetical protein KGF54_002587 [Candida jiufengensis]